MPAESERLFDVVDENFNEALTLIKGLFPDGAHQYEVGRLQQAEFFPGPEGQWLPRKSGGGILTDVDLMMRVQRVGDILLPKVVETAKLHRPRERIMSVWMVCGFYNVLPRPEGLEHHVHRDKSSDEGVSEFLDVYMATDALPPVVVDRSNPDYSRLQTIPLNTLVRMPKRYEHYSTGNRTTEVVPRTFVKASPIYNC